MVSISAVANSSPLNHPNSAVCTKKEIAILMYFEKPFK